VKTINLQRERKKDFESKNHSICIVYVTCQPQVSVSDDHEAQVTDCSPTYNIFILHQKDNSALLGILCGLGEVD
jgi:hypothetical protein